LDERSGKVYLVGAGPGEPGLLTLRGAACLARADLVLYDYLVNPQILQHAPESAERVCLGRHGQGRIISQEEINARMIDAARRGMTVVRLKGGDPMLFARASEELEALAAAKIETEIVPGITAAAAVGGYTGIPLTHRDLASAVAFVTGQEVGGKAQPGIDFEGLARFPGTLVFYMGVTTAPFWSSELISAGKAPDTPTAIVRRLSWPDQRIFRTTLAEVAGVIASRHLRPPVLFVVGNVAGLPAATGWFETRPLHATTVLVTRPRGQAGQLVESLQDLGAEVLVEPVIQIGEPRDWGPMDRAISQIDEFDWLVFSSSNGVESFLNRLTTLGHDLRYLAGLRLAAMGPGTGESLRHYRLKADCQPRQFRAESLAESLVGQAAGQRFLVLRASRGRDVLTRTLADAGGRVDDVVAYESRDVPAVPRELVDRVAAGGVHWTTVTSSSIARSLVRLFGDSLRRTRLASISPITSSVLRESGYPPAVEAVEHTGLGIVQAILASVRTPDSDTDPHVAG
jgi:uroporphyrinogen III methyltransferase/synthase